MKAQPIDPATLPKPRNTEERRLESLQRTIASMPDLIAERNALLATMNSQGVTHRELAARLSRAQIEVGHQPVVEDTVQKAIRSHREATR
jgi:hypothetical protein